jgi:hypothetical protein
VKINLGNHVPGAPGPDADVVDEPDGILLEGDRGACHQGGHKFVLHFVFCNCT